MIDHDPHNLIDHDRAHHYLGSADGKLLAYSSIGLSLLRTNKTFILLSDSAHALPYLASGAGMSLKEGSVLGEFLSIIWSKCDI